MSNVNGPIDGDVGVLIVLGSIIELGSMGLAHSAVVDLICYKKVCCIDYYTHLLIRLTGHCSIIF